MRDIKRHRRQIAPGSLPWGIANGKRKYRDWDSAVQRNDVIGPALDRCGFATAPPAYPLLTREMGELAIFR